jgi:hypothetical protein
MHYSGIVEAISSLGILSEDTSAKLHSCYQNCGLTTEEARLVAAALRNRILPLLEADDWLLPDGTTMTDREIEPRFDDLRAKHRGLTNRKVLEEFAQFCGTCNGFYIC